MQQLGVPLDCCSCNTLLAARGASGAVHAMRTLLEGMQLGRDGLPPPDTFTYTHVFQAAARHPQGFSGAWLLQVTTPLPPPIEHL